MKLAMRRLLFPAGQARSIILYPSAVILGSLLAYAWYLVIVGVILRVFAQMAGAD
jgi:hypothetical protein